MPKIALEFGFYPNDLNIAVGPITIRSLADRQKTVEDLLASAGIENDWIYAPPYRVRDFMSGEVSDRPYPARVFGLPKTHQIAHVNADDKDHLSFHLWSLSFFSGLRLTATEAGFLDATPIAPGKLIDFMPTGSTLQRSIELAETFWRNNAGKPRNTRRFAAAIHALFLGQNPRHLQFERFVFLYTALDACYGLAAAVNAPGRRISHARRIAWMCQLFGMTVPPWADPTAGGGAEITIIRNDTLHEALFMDQPLGFALHGVDTNRNITLEMEALVCRLLVALIGGGGAAYVRTPVDTRQHYALTLS